jgi:hypothetical protein
VCVRHCVCQPKKMSDLKDDPQSNSNNQFEISFIDFLPLFKRKNLGWFSQAGYESFR